MENGKNCGRALSLQVAFLRDKPISRPGDGRYLYCINICSTVQYRYLYSSQGTCARVKSSEGALDHRRGCYFLALRGYLVQK